MDADHAVAQGLAIRAGILMGVRHYSHFYFYSYFYSFFYIYFYSYSYYCCCSCYGLFSSLLAIVKSYHAISFSTNKPYQ